jgi:glycosyltransferase involved in cell wall biosynthesis
MIFNDTPIAAAAADPGRPRPKLFLNGKFYSGATNGVHRVADRLLRELDRLACEGGTPAAWDMRLLVPTARNWAPAFAAVRAIPQNRGHSQFWEQALLPLAARGGVLANFANLAPAWHPNQLTMVHDAQFRISPESYPPKLRWGYRALIPSGAKASRLVLTVSDYARDSLATFGIRERHAIRVLPNGGDHILETEPDGRIGRANGLRPGGYALLFGSVAAYKNVAVVFDAFARSELAGLTLVMIGPSRQTLVDAGLRPPPDAIFVGSVDDATLRSLYEGARCLLYPSRTEGFGLPPVEAMLCNCPVVAAPAGAIPEVCRDAILYAGMDNSEEWARAVQSLSSPDVAAAKISAGRARAAQFTWAAAGLRLVSALAELMPAAR